MKFVIFIEISRQKIHAVLALKRRNNHAMPNFSLKILSLQIGKKILSIFIENVTLLFKVGVREQRNKSIPVFIHHGERNITHNDNATQFRGVRILHIPLKVKTFEHALNVCGSVRGTHFHNHCFGPRQCRLNIFCIGLNFFRKTVATQK